jgi:GMP synthase-like glutamine amidotransferase
VVDYVPQGKVTGSYPVERTEAGAGHFLFDGFADDQLFHFSHGDRVETPPPGSVRPGRSAEAPHAALDHGGGWLSVQFHPEATADLFGAALTPASRTSRARFRVVPGTERMLRNFLVGTGVVG